MNKFEYDSYETTQAKRVIVNTKFFEALNAKSWKDKNSALEELYK